MNRQRIYVASSWRNPIQPVVVSMLRRERHEVYDFRNPESDGGAFSWSEVADPHENFDPDIWQKWTNTEAIAALEHPIARGGFASDWTALTRATCGVLVVPSGRSAHLEAGVMVGMGKPVAVLLTAPGQEAELMYAMTDLVTESLQRLVSWVNGSPEWSLIKEDGPRDAWGQQIPDFSVLL